MSPEKGDHLSGACMLFTKVAFTGLICGERRDCACAGKKKERSAVFRLKKGGEKREIGERNALVLDAKGTGARRAGEVEKKFGGERREKREQHAAHREG